MLPSSWTAAHFSHGVSQTQGTVAHTLTSNPVRLSRDGIMWTCEVWQLSSWTDSVKMCVSWRTLADCGHLHLDHLSYVPTTLGIIFWMMLEDPCLVTSHHVSKGRIPATVLLQGVSTFCFSFFSAVVTLLWIYFSDSKRYNFKQTYSFGNTRSHTTGTHPGEYGGCSNIGICFLAKITSPKILSGKERCHDTKSASHAKRFWLFRLIH